MLKGTVLRTGGGVYRVALDDGGRIDASLRGRLKLESRTGDRVVIGDRVRIAQSDRESFTIEEVLPRERAIVRGSPGRGPRVVAANVDRLLAVVAAAAPDPNRGIVDRLLLVAEANDLDAVLVVNKMDLEAVDRTGRRLAELYRGIGYRTLLTSAETGRGIAELEAEVCSGASALVGPSGAGKSSLLNAVDSTLDLRTGALSRKSRRGRHTTVAARLIELHCGGWVADTPGLGDIGIWGLEPERLETCFPDFVPYLGGCRFRGCAHLEEPGCAVKEAVDGGAIDPGRHATYRSVREELQEAAERRRRG